MQIIHVSAELAPVAKVGGLADVIHGLSRAIIEKQHQVTVVMPKYDTLNLNWIKNLEIFDDQKIRFDKIECHNTLWRGSVDEIPVVFIESHDPYQFFERGKVYGCPDDIARFTYFALSALEYLKGQNCDVVHLHDWHTACLAGLLKEKCPENDAKVILTIHNLAYQGLCTAADLAKIHWRNELLRQGDHYNLLQGGIIFADQVTTVSPTYAQEILTPESGGALHEILNEYQGKISGILNGIDYEFWNPRKDPFLPFHYSVHKMDGKERNKELLKKRLSLADEACPLVCAVTRLVPQKGPELIKAALLKTLEWGGQFVLLGSASDELTHAHFYNLKRKLYGSKHVHFELTFSEELSHLVFAASDLFLMPSLFEPCGLTQQIAMRYGTLPIARATGGLKDTVIEHHNGFLFSAPTAEGIHAALDHALGTWYHHPQQWRLLVENGMRTDFSWNNPADQYLRLYRSETLV